MRVCQAASEQSASLMAAGRWQMAKGGTTPCPFDRFIHHRRLINRILYPHLSLSPILSMEVALPLRRTLSVPCPIIPPLFPPVSLKENPKTDEIILYQPGNPSSSEHKALPNCTLSTPTNNVIEVPNTPSQTELQTEEPSQRSIASSRVRFSSPVVDRVYTYGEDDPSKSPGYSSPCVYLLV